MAGLSTPLPAAHPSARTAVSWRALKTASALILAGTAVAIAVLAAPVHAGEDAGPAFFTLHVPGGRSTIRLAGIPDSVPNGAVLPLLVRLLHADPPGSTAEQDDRLSRVRDRVERLGRVDAAVATLGPGGLSLPASDADDPTQARIGAALASLGLRLSGGSAAVQAEPDPAADAAATREALADAGLDLESMASTLNGGGAVVPKVADLELPAPLDEATWRSVPLGTVPKELTFETVLLDRHAALNLHGLLAMTPSTRSWLAANHSVLARLAYRPAMVSSFGRSLRITDGVVDLPGGPPAAAAWEALARSPVSPAERFVVALFARDEGRLAYFYDTVMRLAPDQQAAALGLSNSGAPDLESLEETYDAFVESLGEWRPFERPFMRPLFDGALVLDELSWRAGGEPAGPRWRRFWSIALDDPALPGKPERLLRRVDRDGEIGPGVAHPRDYSGQRGRASRAVRADPVRAARDARSARCLPAGRAPGGEGLQAVSGADAPARAARHHRSGGVRQGWPARSVARRDWQRREAGPGDRAGPGSARPDRQRGGVALSPDRGRLAARRLPARGGAESRRIPGPDRPMDRSGTAARPRSRPGRRRRRRRGGRPAIVVRTARRDARRSRLGRPALRRRSGRRGTRAAVAAPIDPGAERAWRDRGAGAGRCRARGGADRRRGSTAGRRAREDRRGAASRLDRVAARPCASRGSRSEGGVRSRTAGAEVGRRPQDVRGSRAAPPSRGPVAGAGAPVARVHAAPRGPGGHGPERRRHGRAARVRKSRYAVGGMVAAP